MRVKELPVMDRRKAGFQSRTTVADCNFDIRLRSNNAKPGIPVTAKLMGDPPADYWQRRANPGVVETKRCPRLFVEAPRQKGGVFDLTKGGEWAVSVKRALMAKGWRYSRVVHEAEKRGFTMSLTTVRNILNGHCNLTEQKRTLFEAIAFGDDE